MNNNVVALSLDRVHKYYNTQFAKSDLSKFSTFSKMEEEEQKKVEAKEELAENSEFGSTFSEEELASHLKQNTIPEYITINKEALSSNKFLNEFQYRSYVVPSSIKQDNY
jgi:hypothetical protein